ncbi:flagellar motor protein MotB [Ketobacter sp. MCCC 1A13808]|uniref:flagellar motor protein MotB n=1 Tax=Ketobacter sp. MCCC 1A13808 TaxID=2602738 RepID=UPI0012EB4150|nr:flagellar motor protein MotB [Ketobacter sp. MCCC 1A13808]MVF11383.1 flagellar motor protein MotB [Ketobacter sp. MCCC 1A13808]
MSDEECECAPCPKGLPAYLATFADLMSLLMCFFVLLLAFSEMDVLKYKQVAGSMRDAFGVQNEIKVKDIPKGTSIIAQEFSPGRPDPTPLNEVRQITAETMNVNLDVRSPGDSDSNKGDGKTEGGGADNSAEILERLIAMTQADAVKVAASLKNDIQSGDVEVETRNRYIVIRVKEKGSFPSGSATLRASFIPIMDRIRAAIKDVNGNNSVEGHTDDIPISTARFRSNWELSSARAVSVAHELLKTKDMDPHKFSVVGLADTKPLIDNSSEKNRSRNRRVEIVIEQGAEDEKYLSGEKPLPEDPEFNPDLLIQSGLENLEGFDMVISDDNDTSNPATEASQPLSPDHQPAGPDRTPGADFPAPFSPKPSSEEEFF